jgi:glycosyltransferase involved in cell wall biosynthesis
MAVIVSSISPFAREVWEGISSYQMVRLSLLRSLTLASVKRAHKVFFLSELGYRLVGSGLRDSQIVFLPMAAPPPSVLGAAEEVRLPEELTTTPFFVTVGDLAPFKGVHDAIRAISHLRRDGVPWRLVVCGRILDPRYARRLRSLADEAGTGSVLFMGSVKQEVALAFMRKSLATVVSSRIENPNRVPTEAMAVGAPLLAADVLSSRTVCGDAALYYPAGDHRALAARMEEVADPAERERLVGEGRRRLGSNDWLSASRKILEALELL